jgi:glycosyltransferase involved in cell wall biosynthesis
VAAAVVAAAPDVVHTQLEFSYILGGIAAGRRGIPVVATLHTLEEPPRFTRAWARNRITAWALRSHTDLVIAVSEHARRHHISHLGLDPARVVTLHNGIATGRFAAGPGTGEEVRRELGIPAGVPLMVTVAVLRPPKGISDMLRALPRVAKRIPDVHYLVVGDGPDRPDLEATAAGLGLGTRVHFAGRRADVPRMLAAADLFVLPSHREALPTVVAEAMASGLPVVATRVGGTPEMVSEGHGRLVEPGDPEGLAAAVVELLGDGTLAAAMSARAREVAAEHFDIGRQAVRLVDVYRGLAPRRVVS